MSTDRRRREQNNHFTMELYDRADGTRGVRATKPSDVLTINSKEDLNQALGHFAEPLTHGVKDNARARRHFVERIRPTLRYYCNKYDVEIPQWLASDEYYHKHLSDQDREQVYGTSRFKVREFKQLKEMPGAEGRDKEDSVDVDPQ